MNLPIYSSAATSLLPSLSGEDLASNYDPPTWASGTDQGTNFNAWNIQSGTVGAGSAGIFIGNSSAQGFGDINTNSKAFAAYANPSGGNFIDIRRNLTYALPTGYALSATIAIAFRNGDKGLSLYSDTNFSNQIWNFNVGGGGLGDYYVNGTLLGWDYLQTSIFNVVAKQSLSGFDITLSRSGNTPYVRTGTNIIRGFKFYVANTDAGDDRNNLYFNSFKIYKY